MAWRSLGREIPARAYAIRDSWHLPHALPLHFPSSLMFLQKWDAPVRDLLLIVQM